MTFKEKLEQDYPMLEVQNATQNSCPCDYEYEEKPSSPECEISECEECWNREIPSTEFKQKVANPPTQETLDFIHENIKVIPVEEPHFRNPVIEKAYNTGLNDAWELVNTICGFTPDERYETFGNYTMVGVLANRTPQEALAKLKAYEERIKVGDVVTYAGDKGVVLDKRGNKIVVLMEEGVYEWYECDVEKTGKHIDIKKILEEIGE